MEEQDQPIQTESMNERVSSPDIDLSEEYDETQSINNVRPSLIHSTSSW